MHVGEDPSTFKKQAWPALTVAAGVLKPSLWRVAWLIPTGKTPMHGEKACKNSSPPAMAGDRGKEDAVNLFKKGRGEF